MLNTCIFSTAEILPDGSTLGNFIDLGAPVLYPYSCSVSRSRARRYTTTSKSVTQARKARYLIHSLNLKIEKLKFVELREFFETYAEGSKNTIYWLTPLGVAKSVKVIESKIDGALENTRNYSIRINLREDLS